MSRGPESRLPMLLIQLKFIVLSAYYTSIFSYFQACFIFFFNFQIGVLGSPGFPLLRP